MIAVFGPYVPTFRADALLPVVLLAAFLFGYFIFSRVYETRKQSPKLDISTLDAVCGLRSVLAGTFTCSFL